MNKNKKHQITLRDGDFRDIIIYRDGNNTPKVEVLFRANTLWLTQKSISTLFGVGVPAVSKHIKNILETRELDENSVVSKMETTASDGKNYETAFYNLDLIIAVGYRTGNRRRNNL